MRFDENLAAIHAYLCADGYVIKNPSTQKVKYYKIGLRNTNLTLLRDFQGKFYNYFRIEPHLYPGQRCQIGSKEVYNKLIKKFGSFYSKEWTMPKLNNKLSRIWLRAFFDCESWVFCKTHHNRHIGVDSINEKGLDRVKEELMKLGINTTKKINKKRKMFRIFIYSKENLIKFKDKIGFFHPIKKEALERAINDYMDYVWSFKDEKSIKSTILEKLRIKKPYLIRIISKEKQNLEKLKDYFNKRIGVKGTIINLRCNGIGTIYFELNINKGDMLKNL